MEHLGTQPLETGRLLLRRFMAEDAEPMFKNWASDPEVTKYLTWPAHQSVELTQKVLEGWIASYRNPAFYQWAIVLKDESPEPIGSISVVMCDDDARMALIGYCIGRRWWNRGIASEALRAVMDYLFERVGMEHIGARHDSRNPASGRVMQKCGMRCQGTQRQAVRTQQGLCDLVCYGLEKSQR